jgi:hypothetical protein
VTAIFPFAVYLDTNCINARGGDRAVADLQSFLRSRGANFQKTSALDTELRGYRPGLGKSADMAESLETGVWGFSRWDHAVYGSQKDDEDISAILECLFGKRDRFAYSTQQVMDAMHLHTAGRNGGHFFVTRDDEILSKATAIQTLCAGLRPVTPEQCLAALEKK